MKKKIVLVDGHNLLFRMFYGIPASIKNSKNKEIKGLVGFIGNLKKIVNELNPYSLVVIFDSETSKDNNLEVDENYKQNRIDYGTIPEEENPFSQLPLIKKALNYLDIPNLEVYGNEADDYIASLIQNTNNSEYQYIIISTDSDFIQLIDENTFLYVPKGKNSILLDEQQIMKKYHVPASKYILFKSLVGDKSDNIRGICGIGPITASKILNYTSIEEYIFKNANSKISKRLIDNQDKIIKNKKLISMNKNIDTSNIIFRRLSDQITMYKTYEIIEKIGER